MKKKLLSISCLLLFTGIIGACSSDDKNYPGYSNVVMNFETQIVTINVGDTYIFDIDDIFKNATTGSNYDIPIIITKYELDSGNRDIITVNNNKITAKEAGKTYIACLLYSKTTSCRYSTILADVYITDEDNMIEVKTVDDLINISDNLDGNYILKNNIDLSVIDNWEAIGLCHGPFTGIFVNPYGYQISNMTIRYAEREEFTWEPYKTGEAALFGWTEYCYINGIILKNVLIYNADESLLPEYSSGIAATTLGGLITNCSVSGKIYAKYCAGGIIASNSWTKIYNCIFEGEICCTMIRGSQNGAGGIAGFSGMDSHQGTGIKNCNVSADIYGTTTGGIVGYNMFGKIEDCAFTGNLYGTYKGEIIGADNSTIW